MNVNQWGAVNQWGGAVAPLTAVITEASSSASESSAAILTQAGQLSVSVTELNSNASESAIMSVSANISALVTEVVQNFNENSSVNFVGSFVVEVTESNEDFGDSSYIQLPVIRLEPRKVIRVSGKQRTVIRVR
jgi:hypothetical protein